MCRGIDCSISFRAAKAKDGTDDGEINARQPPVLAGGGNRGWTEIGEAVER
jgi:hypothetical protein